MSNKVAENIIEQIKIMSVMDLSELVKSLQAEFGVSAAMPAAAAPVVAEAPVKEEKSEYKVTLKTSGEKKVEVIKALRKVIDMPLTDAKAAVDSAPTVVSESATKDVAHKIKEALEAAGATVELS
jgi:large subunit ribosomal protein L7/L12